MPRFITLDKAVEITNYYNAHGPSGRSQDWQQDFTHENGMYECKCCHCDQRFVAHKRRVVCFSCIKLARSL